MEAEIKGQKLFTARLGIGLAQGLALYLLYSAHDAKVWPATQGLVFVPLVLVWVFIPALLIQALGEMPWRKAVAWAGVALLVIALLAFFDNWSACPWDWSYGPKPVATPHVTPSPQLIFAGGAGLFIAHALIVGANIDHRVMAKYPTHFDVAWKMAVQLALSAAFVGAFWLLLWLGASLFALIKLDFFRKLIGHEWFAIPVTTLAASGALHLTDIRPALVRGARTLALTLLSWLLPLIALIVTGFLVSLPFTGLTPLWSFGHASALLLTAAAALIILINAAYQDGDTERLPPRILRLSGSIAAALPLPLSAIAAYALYLRVTQYGWTVGRIWLAASVLLACSYAIGYVYATAMRGRWLSRIERWNFFVSLETLAVLVALFTPIASPARIAVADQVRRLNSGKIPASKFDFQFLRWEGGRYGQAALVALSASNNDFTRKMASGALRKNNRYTALDAPVSLEGHLTVYPQGQKLPQSFAQMTWKDDSGVRTMPRCSAKVSCDAILADLDGDGHSEVLIIGDQSLFVQVFRERADHIWTQEGTFQLPFNCPAALSRLREGHFEMRPPPYRFNDIQVGSVLFHVQDVFDVRQAPKCPT
jgi:uncharacterized protein DUF4153